MAQPELIALLGLSDSNEGVLLGWALATGTALGTAAFATWRQHRATRASRKATARLLLEEIRSAQRAAAGDDARLLAAATSLPTEIWAQRREGLVGTDGWAVIARAYGAIDQLNSRRMAHAAWRTEDTADALRDAYAETARAIEPAKTALQKLAE